jgi:hypothetical protein
LRKIVKVRELEGRFVCIGLSTWFVNCKSFAAFEVGFSGM